MCSWQKFGLPKCLLACLLTLTVPGFAEETEDDDLRQRVSAQSAQANGEIEEVVVVGTAIKGTPVDSAFAVTSVNRNELEAAGSPSLSEFFKGLSASHGVLGERSSAFNSDQLNTVDASVANVNLRGLGASRTLVLINGHRQVYLPARLIGGRYVDVNVIPLTAVERVEVLKEGAAAVYGSDALGGVVQFVTRRNFEGIELSAAHEFIEDAGNSKLGLIWGRNFGNAHLTTTFEHETYDALAERDRPYTLASWQPGQRGGWSSFGNPGAYLIRDANRNISDVLLDPQCEAFGGIPASGTTCRYRYQSFFNLIEETEFNRVFSELHGDVGPDLRYSLELLYSQAESPHVLASPSYPFVTLLPTDVLEVAATHPGRMAMCDIHAAEIPQCTDDMPWYFRGRTIGNGGPASSVKRASDSLRLAGGLSGEFELAGKPYSLDLGLAWSRQDARMSDSGTYTERLFLAFRGYGGPDCGISVIADPESPAKMRLNPADLTGRTPGQGNCEYFNPFGNAIAHSAQYGAPYATQDNPDYQPSLANSEELVFWMSNELVLNSEAELLVLDLNLGREWIPDLLSTALGYQYRRFSANALPSDESNFAVHPCQVRFDTSCIERDRFGPYAFTTTWDAYDERQNVHRIFAELALGLEHIDVQFAIDFEQYDEANSLDPKLSLSWRAHPAVTLRASAQTTFRTPSVDELNPDKLTTLQFVRQTGTYIPVDRLGSPDLEPENAFTYNLGAVFFLGAGIEATLDYWQYNFRDVINAAPYNSLVNLFESPDTRVLVADAIICPQGRASMLIAAGESPCTSANIARVEIPLVNWPGIQTSGLDIHLGGRIPLAAGEFEPSLDASYVFEYQADALVQDGLVLEPARDAAGRVNFGHPLAPSIPKFKMRLSGTWLWRSLALSTHLGYIASYKDEVASTSVPRIDDYLTWDVAVQWDTPVSGLRLALSLLNLTDTEAPYANLEQGFDGFTHGVKGRRAKLSLTWSPQN